MNKLLKIAFALFCIFSSSKAFSQSSTTSAPDSVEIHMKDGSIIRGALKPISKDSIEITTANYGNIRFHRDNIKKIIALKTRKSGYSWPENPHGNHYFLTNSSIPLNKGEGYYSNTLLFLNYFNYGFTKNFSMGAGIEIFSTLNGYLNFLLAPKFSFELAPQVHASIGTYYFNFSGFGNNSARTYAGILTPGITIGNSDANLSLGGGIAYSELGWAKNPLYTVSAFIRLSKGTGLMMDNVFVPIEYNQVGKFYCFGARFFNSNYSWDGMIGVIENIPFPLFRFSSTF